MDKRDIDKVVLEQYIRRLYLAAGKTNLHVSIDCKKNRLNVKRIKMELEMIKGLVESIEYIIDNI